MKVRVVYSGRVDIINAACVEITDEPFKIHIEDVQGNCTYIGSSGGYSGIESFIRLDVDDVTECTNPNYKRR